MSSVLVDSPHLIVNEYFFFLFCMKEINLVASPRAIGKTPVANGSKVPPCPIFLIFKILEILETACREVIPHCLSSIIQPLILLEFFKKRLSSSKIFSLIFSYFSHSFISASLLKNFLFFHQSFFLLIFLYY